jgi:hypothetical protein
MFQELERMVEAWHLGVTCHHICEKHDIALQPLPNLIRMRSIIGD